MKIRTFDANGKLREPVESAKVVKSDSEWRSLLTAEQFQVARGKGTERPF